jgi:hypothetical protein
MNIPKARTALGNRINWDGQLSTFMVYKQAIIGHLLMAGAQYLVNPQFHASYLKYCENGLDYLESEDFKLSYPDVSLAQAKMDRGYFFGMLMSSNKNGERKFLLKYSTSQDGIFTWIEFLRDYDNNGDSEIRAEQLESLIHVPYSAKSPGGFLKYIDTLQAYLTELDTLNPGEFTDAQKTKLLYRNLQNHPSMVHLLQTCRDREYDFHTACIYLRTCSVRIDALSNPKSVLHTATEDTSISLPEARAIYTTMSGESSPAQAFQVLNQSPALCTSLHIPPAIWHKLSKEI